MRKINIPVFVSHLGCPNDCIFCDQKKITGVSRGYDFDGARKKIEDSLKTAPHDSEIEIAFFGGSFTGIEMEYQNNYLEIAQSFMGDKRIKGIRLSTRPDYINEEILDNLKKHSVRTIELGVQSMDDKVLEMNKRNLTAQATVYAANLIKSYGFVLGLQMMTGMYASDVDKDINTACEIIKLSPAMVRIYPTVAISGTRLYELYLKGEYTPYSLEKTVDLCAVLYDMFEENNIKVIRGGLMSSSEIKEGKVVGPYHSSFGELVASKRYYKKIKASLEGKDIKNKEVVIYSEKNKVSQILGNKLSNINILKKEYPDTSFSVIERDGFKVEII